MKHYHIGLSIEVCTGSIMKCANAPLMRDAAVLECACSLLVNAFMLYCMHAATLSEIFCPLAMLDQQVLLL